MVSDMETNEKIIIIAAAVLISILTVIVIYGTAFYGADYQKATTSEQEDICATPPGYTDQQWREHMGHHPDRYAKCLGSSG